MSMDCPSFRFSFISFIIILYMFYQIYLTYSFFWSYYKWNFKKLVANHLLLLYRNAIDFCLLILYSIPLLYSLHVTPKRTGLFLLFQFVFTLFSRLIALIMTCGTMLNRRGENEYPPLFLILKTKHSDFHH